MNLNDYDFDEPYSGSSMGNCDNCESCNKPQGYICKLDGDFYTTGEFARIVDEYNITGVSFAQKIESVKEYLDTDTIRILKVLLQDNDAPCTYLHHTALEIINVLNTVEKNL